MPNRQEIGTIDDPSFVWFEAGDETYLELQDSDGNVIIRFNQDQSIDNVGSLSLEQASVSGETVIEGVRDSDTSSTTSGDWNNVFDGEATDTRDEFNASQQFSPDKDGIYEIDVQVGFGGSTTDGDELRFRIRNVTDTSNVDDFQRVKAEGTTPIVPFGKKYELDSTKTYEVQVTNQDSSYTVTSFGTHGYISWSVVHD